MLSKWFSTPFWFTSNRKHLAISFLELYDWSALQHWAGSHSSMRKLPICHTAYAKPEVNRYRSTYEMLRSVFGSASQGIASSEAVD